MFDPKNLADTLGAAAKEKIFEALNKRITGIRVNTGAIIDNIAFIYSDKSVVQIGGDGGRASPVSELKADERLTAVSYTKADFSGYACIGKVEFETNTGRKIAFQTFVPNNAKTVQVKAPAGKYIHSFKGELAGGKYVGAIGVGELGDL